MESDQALAKDQTRQAPHAAAWDPSLLGNGNEHASAEIPFSVIIDGRQYGGRSLSVVTAFASGLVAPELDGKSRIAVLRFDFSGYSITLPVDARISLVSPGTGELRLDFTNPTGEHLPTLRFLLNAYIAGELHSVGPVIAQRDKSQGSQAKPLRPISSFRSALRRLLGMTLTAVVTVALAAIVVNLAYARLFSKDVPRLAVVSGDGETLRALASGQITYLKTNAAKGDVVYAIRSNSGDTLNVTMPCDCRILAGTAREGATLLAGDPVVDVVKADTPPLVIAPMSGEQAKSLMAGSVAELHFADGSISNAKPADGGSAFSLSAADDIVNVRLAALSPIDQAKIGTPVSVKIVSAGALDLKNRFWAFAETMKNRL